jgi:hypothetical protein
VHSASETLISQANHAELVRLDQERAKLRSQTDQLISDLNRNKEELQRKLAGKKLQCQQLKEMQASRGSADFDRVSLEIAQLEKQVQDMTASNALEIRKAVEASQLQYETALQRQEERHIASMTKGYDSTLSTVENVVSTHNATVTSISTAFCTTLSGVQRDSSQGLSLLSNALDRNTNQLEGMSSAQLEAYGVIASEIRSGVAEIRRMEESRAIQQDETLAFLKRTEEARAIRDEERDRKFQYVVDSFNTTSSLVCLQL